MVDRVVLVVIFAGTWGALLSWFESGVGNAFTFTFVSGPAHACIFGLGEVERWLVMAGTEGLGEELVLLVVALLLIRVQVQAILFPRIVLGLDWRARRFPLPDGLARRLTATIAM